MGGVFWRMGWVWIALGAVVSPLGPDLASAPVDAAPAAAPATAPATAPSQDLRHLRRDSHRRSAGEPTEESAPVQAVPGYVQRGQALLSRVPFDPAAVGYTVVFLPPKPGFRGLTWPDSRRIEIYVGDDITDAHLTHVIAHEIGHAIDIAWNSTADRQAWREARGMDPAAAWWPGAFATDFASPAGDFAECFAVWAARSWSSRSQFGSCAGTEALMAELVSA